MLRHTENPGIFRNILLPPNLDILKTLHIIYRQIQVDLKPRLSQACYAYGIFTTLDILKDIICPHFGIFHQFWAYSESWYSYSMPPCYTVQYTTHARHVNHFSTPPTLAQIACHFSNSPKKKGLEDYQYTKIYRGLIN